MVGDVDSDVPELVDLHFGERDGLAELNSAVANNPDALGIGIDEDTAAVVTGTRFEVVGSGAVTGVDDAGARIHVLPAGYEFELAKRVPVTGE